MDNRYKTGDICPETGNWLRIEDNKIMKVVKGDEFAAYHRVLKRNEVGAEIFDNSPTRAHYICQGK